MLEMTDSTDPDVPPEGRERDAQFRELVAHLKQVFWVKNAADSAVHYVSPAYEEIWGRTRSSLYDNSHTFLDSIHPDDRKRLTEVMARKHDTEGYDEEYRILRPDGTQRWIWARTYPVRDNQGVIIRYAGIAEDVTERKWAEKERARLAAIIELVDDAIVSITLNGIIIGWNNGAERKYGYTAEEIIGRSIFILLPPDRCEEYLEVMKRVRNGESVNAYETIRRRKDGSLINFSVGISPIEARDGEIVGVSKIGSDISRVKKLEAQLIEAQKMEVIGQLTGGVAHDFNNILAVIMGYSELMLGDLGVDHPLNKYAAAICNAAVRGVRLTRQLLIVSRTETLQSSVIDLNEVLASVESMLRRLIHEDIELTVVRGKPVGRVKADIGRVEQVLMNLVVNARDAMPGGGKLVIASSDVTVDEKQGVDHPGVNFGDYVMLSISDTGSGMPDEVKAHLFERFFTTKPRGKGTGLGLVTCKTIVEQSGGHIGLHTEAGKGTTFKVYFPRVSQLTEYTARPIESVIMPRGTEAVLVVEGDPEVRRLACMVLRAQGYQVFSAANGEDGLRTMLDNVSPEIRLVISDVIMPTIDGKVMADLLGSRNPSLKVLFTSGYLDDTIAHHGVPASGVAFLPKPYSISTLAHKVRELLDACG